VIPASFEYRRAGSVGEAINLLAENGADAKVLAGGHSLLPLMKLRLAVPSLLIDVGRLSELSYVRDEGWYLSVGALTRHHDLEHSSLLRRQAPVLSYVAGQIGDPQVRHRGTIGGSLAHGDPASDLPAAALALDATMVVEGPDGRREVPASEFFLGFLETSLSPDEVLTEIRVPKAPGRWSFQKFNRRAQDWATVAVVVVEGGAGHGLSRGTTASGSTAPGSRVSGSTAPGSTVSGSTVSGAEGNGSGGRGPVRVALVNMGLTPLRATAVEEAVAGGAPPAEAAVLAGEGTEPATDLNATAEFRSHLASVLVRRALEATLAGGPEAGPIT
jgi:aerobic carbon-monoxide dehydrogenase medium subunit